MTAAKITYIGHATLLIEIDGVRILTDPLLKDWVWHLRRERTAIDETWYRGVDAVLISHIHWDHLHPQSLKLLQRDTRIIVPQGAAHNVRRHGFDRVDEVAIGELIDIGPITVEATYAMHNGHRFRLASAIDCLGYILSGSQTIYFAGDTDLFPEMASLTDKLDVALLPVWGWGPTLGSGHLDPYRAALALRLLRPRLAIPIHWGTFFPIGLKWFLPRLLVDPPHAFARFAGRLAEEVDVQIVAPGRALEV